MSAERVVVTRTEMRQIREHVNAVTAIVDAILQRPEPTPPASDDRGWPLLGGNEDQS
ncbi:hypothetical protein OHB24_27120 [Kribbella sp. NBC_00482]|uniref:hypothetical protein n=1 Tax=Kribbella sp. NBC_00482 TaxID=2975968 RepID=UPI002E19AC3F